LHQFKKLSFFFKCKINNIIFICNRDN